MQTVVGVFDDRASARRAIEALIALGLLQGQARLHAGDAAPGEGGLAQRIGGFFQSMLGARPEPEAWPFAEAARRGDTLVSVDVHTDAQARDAAELLRRHGAIAIDEHAEHWQGAGQPAPWVGGQPGTAQLPRAPEPLAPAAAGAGDRDDTPAVVAAAMSGRRLVERAVPGADLPAFVEGVIEIRETAEQIVLGKTAHVIEEVVLGREAREQARPGSDTVRRSEVRVERIEPADVPAAAHRPPASGS